MGSPEAVLSRLRQLPEGLETLYDNLYASMKAELSRYPADFRVVRLAFLFTLYGNPWVGITTEAILEAIHGRRPNQSDRRLLFEFCSGFLQEDLINKPTDPANDRCRFSHVYVNDFLRSHKDFEANEAQFEIGDLCFSRVMTQLRPTSQEKWQRGDFFCYAITQWLHHYVGYRSGEMRMVDESACRVAEEIDARLTKRLELYPSATAPSFEACVRHIQTKLSALEDQGVTALKMILEAAVGMTTAPSNALFAAAMWGDTQILNCAETMADSLWQQTNVQGLTALEYAEDYRYHVRLGPPLEDRESFEARMQRASRQHTAQ
jgi:hypothetical protein